MRQRGDAWELRVYLGRDPVTDKQRYATRTVRAGKRAAQRALATMVTEAERGLVVRTNSTVGELLEAWFDQAVRDFSPKTVKETRGFIDRNLLPEIGDVPLTKLKASDLDRFYRQLQTSGGAGGRALSPATVRRIHGILRRALTQGVKWGWIGVNPAAATTPPRVPQKEIKPPSGSELAGVLKRAEETSPELACFLMLAAATGARRSELVALRWHDVDVAAGIVRIERGVVNGPDGLVEKDTKTHAARRVALDSRTVGLVRAHRELMAERADRCGTALDVGSFVFSNAADGSEPWYPDSVSRGFKRLCAAEGLTGVRLHDLRHFVATQLLSAGVDVRTVAGRLGHRNAATTLNVYAHFLEDSDRAAADIMGGLISGDTHDGHDR
ncbi:tyrosine-type recombinase/integrase [Desertimonas flava]|uniref:tyrosine-type recombinase/integrase n=1 Tax=Desertimonas flava TaxID=2064846 RepID=UPI0013C4A4F0|nr:site-specific integrase [Desertimonas flava]